MTENEAIEWLAEETSPTLIHIAEMKKENPMEYINEAVKVACRALEEIQQYREIGTVEDLKSMKENGAFSGVELAQIACMQIKLKEYQEIGTVEEFKDLKEKATPKKPILSKSMITEKEYQICPICERLALYDGIKFDYCQYCGQKLDWEGGE